MELPWRKKRSRWNTTTCGIREVKEEVGVEVNELHEIHQGTYEFSSIKWTGHFFVATSVSGLPSLNEMDKIKGIQFIKDYAQVEFPEELLEVVKYLFEEESNIKIGSTYWY